MLSRFLRGSPLLSALFGVSVVCGPMVVAVRCEVASPAESIFRNPLVLAVVPADFLVLVVCVFALFSIRNIEPVIGTLKTTVIGLTAYVTDSLVRTFLRDVFGFEIPASGPYVFLTTLLCLYCIFVPTVRAHFFPVNEKALLLLMLLLVAVLDHIRSGILISLGFLLFLLLGPLCYPAERPKHH